jgi:hypothetical protein
MDVSAILTSWGRSVTCRKHLGGGVYVSYACPQTYGFDALKGGLMWHYAGPCEGGGGSHHRSIADRHECYLYRHGRVRYC